VSGVKPVDGGRGKALLHDAVVQHGQNGDVYDAAKRVVFRDDPFAGGKIAIWSPSTYVRRLAASSTAVYAQASWLDAGTATGALSRFASSHNPQQLVIGPWNHGGSQDADPFRAADEPAQPTATQQFHDLLAFFDATVKRDADRTRTIRYYTLDGGGWHTTTTWPPNGTTHRTWYLLAHGGLATTRPRGRAGADRYRVDFTASSGPTNRWHTDATGGDVVYPDRASQDRKLLTYTSAPLAAATDITGAPVVTLQLRSTATDGAFFVYLEDVAPNGRVTYVTEGELRALDRKISRRAAPYHVFGPYRSYMRSDGAPLVPGRTAELRFTLQPTSVVFPKGHRLRVAIAGADRGTFARVPATGRPVITVLHNSIDASRIELPYNVDIPT
jgi:putative CocE/NonD family hydrolase